MPTAVRLSLAVSLLALPEIALASVAISEVAWMGGATSANHEWIELYNTSDTPASLEGWVLTDGNSLEIVLGGSLAGGSFGVLERTSDESAPGSALLVYTGALVNTGTTLTLKDAQGVIVDQVVGGENWESIGGSNATKDTAQYSGTKWVTAPGTPGRANATESAAQPEVAVTTNSTGRSSSGNLLKVEKKTVTLELANTTLTLRLVAPELVYVGQSVEFSVEASGPTKVVLDSLKYQWNFGDLATSSGQTARHRYRYPGEYVVTVYGTYGRHEQVARATVTVLPVTLSLGTNEDGVLQVHNDAAYEVLTGGFSLRTGEVERTFPEHSVLLPRATVTIAGIRPHGVPVYLRDSAGRVVATLGIRSEVPVDLPMIEAAVARVAPTPAPQQAAVSESVVPTSFTFTSSQPETEVLPVPTVVELAEAEEIVLLAEESKLAPTPTATPKPTPGTNPNSLYGLAAVLTVAIFSLFLVRPPQRHSSTETP